MVINDNSGFWMNILDWAYDRALTGATGIDKASTLAIKYARPDRTLDHQVTALVQRQRILAGSSGFITGLGGFMTLPVAIPANIASVVFIQIRMIAAIAHLGGYDTQDKKVKSLVLACMAGNVAKDILQEAGIRIGTRVTQRIIENISEKTLIAINQKIGFALVAKSGSKGMINISKAVPLAGGVVGGSIDIISTGLVGRIARRIFIDVA